MEKNRILIIDDDENLRDGLINLLNLQGYEVSGASDGKKALEMLEDQVFDLIITDYKMQEIDGMSILRTIGKQFPAMKVIMITGFGSTEHAVEAMQAGALNYILKPVNPQKLIQIVEDSIATPGADIISKDSNKSLRKLQHFQEMVGMSKPMQEVYQKIKEVAPTDIPVLILGESGTGKELVSRAIHNLSSRSEGNFVAVNTGGIPKDLIASELFGHLKGAFTGAISDKKGKFEEAHQGSLFLDEISTMSIPVQISLLRVLETNVIERVGSTRPIKVDVRIVCASNENLQEQIRQQKFREDLYYRLNVVNIELPPLRKRKQDIPYLVKYFRTLFNLELNKNIAEVSSDAMELFKNYSWPGNIRELRNVLLRAVLTAQDKIEVKHLPKELTHGRLNSEVITLRTGTPLSEVEKIMILQTLDAVKGNKLRAAEILGITRRSLYNKLDDYSIDTKKL
ncbi:MAG: sigma-54-dependent Fis family transcriptional regulator [Calditrichaeota bacterium]|nr:sigma-54-dependent Fis family transcriptional regulator [Calditrichota bacterium]RQW02936.1 MAG: sigma-54-dependent Fis family transcriptional regulator [Calditrichota bacterium]